jgi:hypothetical protein
MFLLALLFAAAYAAPIVFDAYYISDSCLANPQGSFELPAETTACTQMGKAPLLTSPFRNCIDVAKCLIDRIGNGVHLVDFIECLYNGLDSLNSAYVARYNATTGKLAVDMWTSADTPVCTGAPFRTYTFAPVTTTCAALPTAFPPYAPCISIERVDTQTTTTGGSGGDGGDGGDGISQASAAMPLAGAATFL